MVSSTNTKRVLIVDDEQIVRDSCSRVLSDAGYTVRTVCNGRDALDACRQEPVDVMLTDIRMPDMDGLEVARAIRREFPNIRVLIITGYPTRESSEQAKRLGIFDYIEKPLNPSRLNAATAAALASPPLPVSDDTDDTVDSASTEEIATPSTLTENNAPGESESADQPAPEAQATTSRTECACATEPCSVAEETTVATNETVDESAAVAAPTSVLKTLTLLALSPLFGLALVIFLPVIGFGMFFAAIGSRLFGSARA